MKTGNSFSGRKSLFAPFVIVVAALFVASGCGPKKISLKQSFWDNTAPRIGVVMEPIPEVDTHLFGLPLLQYGIIRSANVDVRANINGKIDSTRFSSVRDQFVKILSEKGFQAKALPDMTFKKANAQEIAKTNNVDSLIVITVKGLGTLRKYVTVLFIPSPVGPPQGFFQVEGKMVSLGKGEVLWRALLETNSALVPIEEPWDQREEGYPNVVEAVKSAGKNAGLFLANDFFGKNIKWEPIDLSQN